MFDKKSEYALNKYDQDSIIYISVSGRIRLTPAPIYPACIIFLI